MSAHKKNQFTAQFRIILLILLFIVISFTLFEGGHLVTYSQAHTCRNYTVASHQFSIIALLSENCAGTETPKGVCTEGKTCNTN